MRWKRRGVLRTVSGATIGGATVQIYLAGTTTPATAYEAASGGAIVNQISADNQGRYEYYVDSADYDAATRFKEVITSGSTSTTLDNIPIVRWDPTVDQSLDGALTITGAGNGITLPGELTINSAGNGITFPDGTRMTSNAAPGSGVTNTGDVSIAADSDADGVGEITLSTKGVTRARVPNAGGLEINDSGTWRQTATQDGAETLSNKTLSTPAIGDFSNAQHNHSGPAGGGALSSITITDATLNGSLGGAAIKDEDDMVSNSATAVPTQQSVKAYVQSLIPMAPIPLTNWQTDPNQYTVLAQDAADSDSKGQDLLYKYVFPADTYTVMYTQILLPFGGYDLQFCFSYRMSTSNSGNVLWTIYSRTVSIDETYTEIANWSAWAVVDDRSNSRLDTPSSTANKCNLISGAELVIPSTAYSAYDTLQLAFRRYGTDPSDTHTGDAEVDDAITLVPVLP